MADSKSEDELLRLKTENDELRLEIASLRKPRHRRSVMKYCLIAAGVSLTIISVVNGLGSILDDTYQRISK
jgi:hypothetical protein